MNGHVGRLVLWAIMLIGVFAGCSDDLGQSAELLHSSSAPTPEPAATAIPTPTSAPPPTFTPAPASASTRTPTFTPTPELTSTSTPSPVPTFTSTRVPSQDDVTAPELVELSLDPHEVDVSAVAATITITVRVADDLSGIERVQLDFVSPSGGQESTMFVVRGPTTGTSTDGIWVDSIILPRFSESGTWKLREVYLHDEVENLRHYRSAELSGLGFSRSIEVKATQDDVTAPELVELSLDPHEVDVSAGAATITVTVRVTDDLSGTDRVQLDFVSPSGGQESTMFVVRGPTMGTSTDGIWVDSIILPRFSESGTWKLREVYLHDEVENLRHYRSAELSGLGLSRSFEVVAKERQ